MVFKLKQEQGAAMSGLGERGTLACCCRPSLFRWCSLPDAAGVGTCHSTAGGQAELTETQGPPLAGNPLLSLGSAAVGYWQ